MLPKANRVTRKADFGVVLRSGRRAGSATLVAHVWRAPTDSWSVGDAGRPARAGFVISSKVGNSVVRHQVVRRLRAQVRPVLDELGDGTMIVVRALPAAADASSARLAADLRSTVRRSSTR